jgi:hypothetical protein
MTAAESTAAPLDRIDVLTLEMRALGAEMRTGFAETRLSFVELETKLGARIDAVGTLVETVIDSLADFRREYQEHTHE